MVSDASDLPERVSDTEEVDALPVPDERERTLRLHAALSRPLAELRSAPSVQAAAVAAGGFVAGAAVVGLTRRHRAAATPSRRMLRRAGRRGRADGVEIVASRSLLVDLHLLGSPSRGR